MPTVHLTPTAEEQLLLELANRLRLDPDGDAERLMGVGIPANIQNALTYFGVDVAAFDAQMQAYPAVAPLAWNTALAKAATVHTQLMIDFNEQSHKLPGEDGLKTRFAAQGYTKAGALAENVYAWALDPLYAHAGFVIDWGNDATDFVNGRNGTLHPDWKTNGDGMQDPAGHRLTLLNHTYQEVGIAMLAHTPVDPRKDVGPLLVTQDFGNRWGYKAQLLGVVIKDADADAFYDIGEGLGGVTVTASGSAGSFSTVSWSSGGYQMELPPGNYTVSFAGGSLTGIAAYSITMATQNFKLDAFAADASAAARSYIGTMAVADILFGSVGDDLLFGDGYRAAYDMDEAKAVYRLYQATLDRAPDTAGLADWTERLANGSRSLGEVATGFVNSTEFQSTYKGLSNGGFVELLYQNVLNRAADAGGLADWTGRLDAGTFTKAQVVTGFSQSNEFRLATDTAATRLVQERDAAFWTDDVYRLYQATLDRAPDAAGHADWANKLANGTPFLTAVAGFVNSTEFQTKYNSLSNSAFVELLYQNVLDRAADAGGLADWVSRLEAGTYSRAAVVQGFSQSAEFVTATKPDLIDWVRAQGVQDVLDAGGGTNKVWGGTMSDQFVFNNNSGGTTHVMDFEAWDYLNFQGFGHVIASDVLADFTQSGADVVFSEMGTTVIIANTLLSQITEDNILM